MSTNNISPDDLRSVKKSNTIASLFHFFQGTLIMIFAYTLTRLVEYEGPRVFSNFLKFDEETGESGALVNETKELFTVPFIQLVAGFLLLTAFFHFLVSTIFNVKYSNDLKKGINAFRWIEYSITSTIMIALIALLFGVNDIGALVLLMSLNVVMNLNGLVMERANRNSEKTDWTSFITGSIAGLAVWVVLFMFAFGNSDWSEIPNFVYAITASYFIFFNLFPVNMFLQYKKVGKWKDYIFGEKMYILLSFFSKTILAWIVFAGILQP